MTGLVRTFLLLAAILFGLAALLHGGVLARGYEHPEARTAESVIALVLIAGLAATFGWPSSSRAIGLGAQGFALLGTCVGLLMIIIGVGPRTALDLLIHTVMIVLLVTGWIAVWRRSEQA